GEQWSAEAEEEFRRPIRERYDHQGSPYYSTARIWDDGIIDPLDTRRVLRLALSAAANTPLDPVRYGIFRVGSCSARCSSPTAARSPCGSSAHCARSASAPWQSTATPTRAPGILVTLTSPSGSGPPPPPRAT